VLLRMTALRGGSETRPYKLAESKFCRFGELC
jgi:hypothetical protein